MTDNEVIGSVLQGNKEKFRLLVDKYQKMVFTTCLGFVHNKDDADDLTQEVFIRVFESLASFKGDAAFSTWLYRIAVNASLNKVRKSPFTALKESLFHEVTAKETLANSMLSDEENPEKILIRQEHNEWISKALDSLPENQKTALVLSKYDDLPQREIAEIMNITEGAVEALLQRGKTNLRKKLSSLRKKY